MRDSSFKEQSRFVSEDTVADAVRFLAQGLPILESQNVQIIFHGGEPLLVGKERFRAIAKALRDGLSECVKVSFALQTNATLIDDGWINLFEEFDVGVGVSLDGPQYINDRRRLTLTNGGSHAQAVAGIRQLIQARNAGKISSVGLLCVIDPRQNPSLLLNHFVDELKVNILDFLLPDNTHEDKPDSIGIGEYLTELFDEWILRNDPTIQIRVLSSVLSLMLGGRSRMIGYGMERPLAFTLNVDGSLSPDDTLRACGHGLMDTGCTVRTSTLMQFLTSERMSELRKEILTLPTDCRNCEWRRVCGGGHLVHRFDPTDGFDHSSVVCDGLKTMYRHIAAYLIHHGYQDRIGMVLCGEFNGRHSLTSLL